MDTLILILLALIIALCILTAIYITYYNKLQDYIIKINEVESILDNNLRDKYDNLNKGVTIIKSNDDIKEEDKKSNDDVVDAEYEEK